jgi:hypothetical protein
MSKSLLIVCIIALLVCATMGESVIEKLKAKVVAGTAAAPCDKAAPAAAAAPKPFLDIRLPVVVDDYHAPVGGFNPSHIPDKEVDVAARKILREIQAHEAEQKANGDEPAKADENLTLSTEEHVALKQLLLDADILIRAANKLNGENGHISAGKAASAAVAAAADLAKVGGTAPRASNASGNTAGRKTGPNVKASAPGRSSASAAAAGAPRTLPKVRGTAPRAAQASGAAAARGAARPTTV